MIGTSTPRARSFSLMCGTAAAASDRSTVTRTSSDPARARAATCAVVAATPAVSVLVIDCTTIGAPPPSLAPAMSTGTEARRAMAVDEDMGKLLSGRIGSASAEAQGQWRGINIVAALYSQYVSLRRRSSHDG